MSAMDGRVVRVDVVQHHDVQPPPPPPVSVLPPATRVQLGDGVCVGKEWGGGGGEGRGT